MDYKEETEPLITQSTITLLQLQKGDGVIGEQISVCSATQPSLCNPQFYYRFGVEIS